MEYQIVMSDHLSVGHVGVSRVSNTTPLDEEVNELIQKGWKPHGRPFCVKRGECEDYAQAMIKE